MNIRIDPREHRDWAVFRDDEYVGVITAFERESCWTVTLYRHSNDRLKVPYGDFYECLGALLSSCCATVPRLAA